MTKQVSFKERQIRRGTASGSHTSQKMVFLAAEVTDFRLCQMKHLAVALGNSVELTVACENISNLPRGDVAAFQKVARLVQIGNAFHLDLPRPGSSSRLELHVNPGLVRHLLNEQYDLTMSEGFGRWSLYAYLSKWLTGSRVITSFERTPWTERANSRLRDLVYGRFAKHTSLFVSNGRQSTEVLASMGVPPQRVITPNLACHESFYQLDDLGARDANSRPAELSCLIVAQLIERKGLRELLTWVGSYPERERLHISIIGSGPLLATFEGIVKNLKLGEQVQFLGPQSRDFIQNMLTRCSLALLPTKEDNWSLFIAEAVAAGRVAATTPYNGLSGELVVHGLNGFVFDVLSQASTHEMLDLALSSQKDFPAMEKLGRQLAARYHPSVVAHALATRILDELAGSSREVRG